MRIRTRQITFGKYPVEEKDSNLYILWGHNPDASDFPLKMAMEENLAKGARLVVIDPKHIPLADKAEMYLRIRPGTDGALAMAMMNVIINEKLYDEAFIEEHTLGFDKLVPHVQQYTPEWAEEITWVSADDIRKLARVFAGTKGASIFQGTCEQPRLFHPSGHHGQHQCARRLGDQPPACLRQRGIEGGRGASGRGPVSSVF
jgi:anaerobic selenocysteine-containing dehydrogenase